MIQRGDAVKFIGTFHSVYKTKDDVSACETLKNQDVFLVLEHQPLKNKTVLTKPNTKILLKDHEGWIYLSDSQKQSKKFMVIYRSECDE